MECILPAATLPVLTEAHLIRSAQAAIAEHRLGIQRGATEPLFVDEDGAVCAIGAALSVSVLEAILMNGDERLTWLALVRAGYFTHANLRTVEALASLQLGYDACFLDGRLDGERVRRFCAYVSSLDPNDPPPLWPSELA
ncbi:hypothetical protein [Methylobacterium durans]|uniref:Uncharacterized protein n=1 Tax=Methylobacterium durans TaxID=2202825 RepID=A0A2U8W2X1_9HYPH|nr:hypothetical protein [Methylobacterium durans]AWN39702.1 hypothetical protein DK389_03065 [Methylobacterium durans]